MASTILAPTPPMGWNSWNSFATTINEEQALEMAAIMADKLLPSGYDVFTIDIQWYEPAASSYNYNAKPVPTMDGFGRVTPALNRFPSAANDVGFSVIAEKVHALGLKFAIHIMRGIPRLAVEQNLPVFGTDVRATDIADTTSICSWNPDMYGVDMSKPGAQAYYDSIFALYASWGVDFIKMDDMSRPYDAHAPEIEAAALAIRNSGRSMVLSLSPGETPLLPVRTSSSTPRCGASATTSGMNGPCSTPSSPGWKTGTRGAGPAPGPMPTCCRSAGWRWATVTRCSRQTSSRR